MKLRSSPPSPFGRKVKIAARMLGLWERIEVVEADTMSDADSLRRENPLGKIPALILEDRRTLYDSRVIVEYLDHLAGGNRLLPADPAARLDAGVLQALADGLMDAGVLQRYEALFHDEGARSERWLAHQRGKVARGLAALESAPPQGARTIGQVATACALGYLDFRFEGAWRQGHPRLVAWLAAFAADVPAYGATAPKS